MNGDYKMEYTGPYVGKDNPSFIFQIHEIIIIQ